MADRSITPAAPVSFVANPGRTNAQGQTVGGHRFINLDNPVAATLCRNDPATVCDLSQPGGVVMQEAADQNQPPIARGKAIGHSPRR